VRRQPFAAAAAGAAALAIAAGAAVPFGAANSEPPPIAVEPLSPRGQFTDDVTMQLRVKPTGRSTGVINVLEPSRTVVAEITVQPGAQFPWHTHPGPVVANVASGELTYVYADDCVHRPYPAGTVFIDPGHGNVHTAYNSSDEVTIVMATFFEAPAEGSLTIPAAAPTDCEVGTTTHEH
jgi:quercetin dioxygenase-like cupin family protein